MWSPLFSETGSRWVRRRDTFVGNTALPREVWSGSMVQQPDGPTWCVTGKMADEPRVWVDTGPIADDVPGGYPRLSWLGAKVPGMGPAAQLALAPDGKVYLLHEGGCSLLRLNKLARGAKPKLPTWTNTPPIGIDSAVPSPSHVWEIEEVARRRWDGPRNDFSLVAFDATGVWFIPTNGPLIRVPLPW